MFNTEDLKKCGCSNKVISHCVAVSKKALFFAQHFDFIVDFDNIKNGAMLHDIGRCRTNGIIHAVIGAKIAKELGANDEVIKIVERHIGVGITQKESVKLGIPIKDYIPKTPEEKIVAYADNLTTGTRHITYKESNKKFIMNLGENHPSIKRFSLMHAETLKWINKQ